MTINIADNSPRISYTVAQGATQTSFAVPFEFFDNADLNVYIDGTLKTITTHYTVSGGDGSTGTVSMSVTGGTGGSTVVITRDIELERTTDFPVSGAFNIVALNTELDRLVAITADLNDLASRSLQLSDSETSATLTLPIAADRINKVLAFNSTGNALVTQELGTFKGNWAASTAYVARDIVKDTSTNNIFIVNADHTSSGAQPLTTNANSAKYDLIVDAASSTTAQTAAAASATAAAASETAAQTAQAASETAKTASETAKTASETAQAASEAALDSFDDRYLGAKSTSGGNPTVDNDGDALIDGALFFDTTNNVLMVYNLGTTTWLRTTPTSSDQTAINAVNADATDIGTVASNISNVNTVAGNNSNVSTVAGISSNVTSVANDATDIGTVATNISNVNTVAGISSNVTTVAGISSDVTTVAGKASLITADFVADLNTLAVTDVINDINTLATSDIVSDLNTLATSDIVSDINLLATSDVISDLNTLATSDIVSDINTLATSDIVSDLNTLATSDFVSDLNTMATTTNVNNLSTVAGISSNVTTVAGIDSNVTTVAGISSNVTTVAGISSAVTGVNTISSAVSAVNSNSSNINTVSSDLGGSDTIGTVAGAISNVNSVASNATNINSVASNSTNINAVAADATDIGTVAGGISNINSVAGSITNVNTVATNLSSVNDFADKYRIGSSDPSSNNDEGDLFYNTTSNTLKVYTGSAWEQGVTAGSGFLPLTGGQLSGNLTFSGTQTVDGRDVSADGTKLDSIESGATADQTASEILTAIKTVDGASSGLDADLLDGVQGSSYLRSDANDTFTGTLTVSGSAVIDDITINGSTISDAADLTIDVAGDIILDADSGEVWLKDGGTNFGRFFQSSGNLYINQPTQDKDIIIQGNDGGSNVNALTFNMADAGTATFNHDIKLGPSGGNVFIYYNNAKWLSTPSNALQLVIGDSGSNAWDGNTGVKLMFGSSDVNAQAGYYIGTNLQNYNGNYNKLDIDYATGIRIKADKLYGGTRFYDVGASDALILSVGTGNSDVAVANNLSVGDSIIHEGDTDTKIVFGTNTIEIFAGGASAHYLTSTYTNTSVPFYNYAGYFDESSQLTGTTPTINAAASGVFYLTMSGNTTFTFTGTSANWGIGFILYLTGNGSTVTWPASVDWAGGTAPDAPANGETDVLVFTTRDGSNWVGALAVDAAA